MEVHYKLKLFLFFTLGSCWGSFIYCSYWREKNQISLTIKRSFCDNCHKSLKIVSLIPIISFLIQKGRCCYCKNSISWVSTCCELIMGCCFSCLTHSDYNLGICLFVICWTSWLTIEDLQNLAVSQNLLFGGSLIILAFLKLNHQFQINFLASAGILFVLLSCFVILRWLGSADLILLIITYFLFGFWKLLLLLLLVSTSGIIVCLILKTSRLPLIPFITLGIFILFLI
ncbi:prepilin peptidase [Liquorilactobacillus nagelii]|uniref:prepilin peptidase n=1 Tax=Liquorilactobacillus nagelii TaxID=82688 RepID=UPI0036F1ECC4